MDFEGRYFDGTSLEPVPVRIQVDDHRLLVKDPDGRTISAHPFDYIILLFADRHGHRVDLGVNGLKDVRLMVEGPDVRRRLEPVLPQVGGPVRNDGWAGAAKVSAFLIGFFALLGILGWQLERVLPYMVPDSYAKELGAQLADNYIDMFGGTCSTPKGDAAFGAMVARLTTDYDTRVPLIVRVSNNDLVNAFALPGGQIVLFKGLISEAQSADEVAGVLAHEIGHVKNRHALRGVTRAMGLGIIASLVSGSNVADLTQQLVSLSFSRGAEREADEEAVKILGQARLSTEPLAAFFDRLASERETGMPDFVSILSTHPMSVERAAKLRDTSSNNQTQPVISDAQWSAMQAMCETPGSAEGAD